MKNKLEANNPVKHGTRVLIKEDRDLLKLIVDDLKGYKAALSSLNEGYNELQMGKLTNELFTDLVHNGLAKIDAKYKDNLESELDRTGVLNPILRKAVLSATEPVFQKFESAYSKLLSYTPSTSNFNPRPTLKLESISLIGDHYRVSEAEEENILEQHCRIYLQSDDEKQFYGSLSNLQDALNTYLQDYSRYELDGKVNGLYGLNTFFDFDDFKVTIKVENINYGVTVADKVKKLHSQRNDSMRDKKLREEETARKFRAGELPSQRLWKTLNPSDDLVN